MVGHFPDITELLQFHGTISSTCLGKRQNSQKCIDWPVFITKPDPSGLRYISNTMGHMAGCYILAGRVTMLLLIVKKHICSISAQKLALFQSSQKEGFIDPYLPLSQGSDDPFMGGCRARRDQSSANGAIF